MVPFRPVRPRYACEPGSAPSPSYASTSVILTATAPSGIVCVSTAPSSRGATSSAGASSRWRSASVSTVSGS